PCEAKRLRIGAAAEIIRRGRRQPDAVRRRGHARRRRERLDKLALGIGRPARAALSLQLRGGEGGKRSAQALRSVGLRPGGASGGVLGVSSGTMKQAGGM
ncbi:MAG: hypothetical protein Q7T73_00105, partial [Beijerinckiaceae bacterium]|nr:hypothetical protein [Beijerinckiaceae bacterium]